MKTLLTKVQYKGYEPGEFTNIAERSYEETVALIQSFDWEQQRHNAVVQYTGPSVSMENETGILKLGTYYNSKYILRLATEDGYLYEKIVLNLSDALPLILAFCSDSIPLDVFKRKKNNNLRKHFNTKDFTYKITLKRIIYFNLVPNIIIGLPFLILVFFAFQIPADKINVAIVASLISSLWIFLFGINWIVFLNYYNYEKDKVIIISKGQDVFQYGYTDNLKTYRKSEIEKISELQYEASRNPYDHNRVHTVYFQDGSHIILTNLLIANFEYKTEKIPRVYIKTFFPHLIKKQR
ncbi:MAG TPA: hypothetical protein VGD89_00785 [Flavipsychrobacter sp.]